jgi:PQ loop repeat
MAIEEFSEERIQQFLRDRRKRDSKRRGDNATLRSLLKHLREATVVGPPVSQDQTSHLNQLHASFAQYLREQRGLRPTTLEQYLFHTRRSEVPRLAACYSKSGRQAARILKLGLNMGELSTIVGFVAGLVTTAANFPQVWKTYRNKSAEGLSFRMLLALAIGPARVNDSETGAHEI